MILKLMCFTKVGLKVLPNLHKRLNMTENVQISKLFTDIYHLSVLYKYSTIFTSVKLAA